MTWYRTDFGPGLFGNRWLGPLWRLLANLPHIFRPVEVTPDGFIIHGPVLIPYVKYRFTFCGDKMLVIRNLRGYMLYEEDEPLQ